MQHLPFTNWTGAREEYHSQAGSQSEKRLEIGLDHHLLNHLARNGKLDTGPKLPEFLTFKLGFLWRGGGSIVVGSAFQSILWF